MTNTSLTTFNFQSNIKSEVKYKEFVTLKIEKQVFGIPVEQVRDVIRSQKITKVPLAPAVISGSLNLRGKIVTVVDVRNKLGLASIEEKGKSYSIIVEHMGEPYSLVVDSIGEVLKVPTSDFEQTPSNISKNWSDISSGVFRLKDEIMIVIDIKLLLTF